MVTPAKKIVQVMEIFTLAAISRGGLQTLYELQQTVGLQPGGLLPVIRRLQDCGFLVRSAEAKRRRRTMKVTEAGEGFLTSTWETCLESHRDLESILRGATVALFMEDPVTAFNYLHRMAAERERLLRGAGARPSLPAASPIESYGDLRALYEERRRAMEVVTLRESADRLAEMMRKRDIE